MPSTVDIGEYIDGLVKTELRGDRSRFDELWERVPNFGQRLREHDRDSAWLHWRPKTFDGWYCLRANPGYVVFAQERGAKSDQRAFSSEREAVRYAVSVAVYRIPHEI